ncbi:hypothetical protein FUAX_09880 [Fulvitalea axinellae]|uniref:Uncharacterized protein n=1 Tax=Fulvitalea axinellae TaxID=1182444 RepID=A0AAU9C8U8_9BACT|nr:hypothetical protein FUAX_09880 [Fulvitalea axinellae]
MSNARIIHKTVSENGETWDLSNTRMMTLENRGETTALVGYVGGDVSIPIEPGLSRELGLPFGDILTGHFTVRFKEGGENELLVIQTVISTEEKF